ncbi:hypothetical protein ACFVZH_07745 [Streptomyces sp. NPDC059534]|uniref:hypothetical protein n=1 Tax=Streptomyces sp. NPDC059534 TaxID=3346859 RepID=UPI00369890BA
MFAAVCVLLAATGHVLMSGHDLPPAVLAPALAGTLAAAWFLAGRERGLLAVTVATMAVQSALHAVFSWSQQHGASPSAPLGTVRASTAQAVTDQVATSHAAMGHMGLGNAGLAHVAMSHTGKAADTATAHMAMGHADMAHMTMSHMAMGHMTMSHMPSASEGVVHQAVAQDMTNMPSSLGMLSAHLLAALLSGLWMAYGERAAFRLLRSLPLSRRRPLWPLWLLLVAVVPVPPQRPRIGPVRAADERPPRQLLLAHSVISRGPPRALAVF